MKVRKKKDVQEPSHKKYKRKEKLRKILRLIKGLLTVAILTATVIYAALSPVFNIDDFRVKSSEHYTGQVLISGTGIIKDTNGFRILFDEPGEFYFFRIRRAERSILENCPYVKSVKVRYLVPSTITIEVEERNAAAVLSLTGTSLLIDREGYLLEVNPDLNKNKLPVIKGIKPDAFKPGRKIDIPEETLSSAFEIFETIGEMDTNNEDKLMPSVDYVDVGNPDKIGLSLQSRILVNLGKLEDLNYKINTVKTIFNNNIKKNERGKLDFYTDGNPVFTPESGG